MSAIETAANQVDRDASVPTVTSTAPVRPSAACASKRSRIGPVKSTSRSNANDPIAANVARIGLPITTSPSANSAGMTIAARVARRSAVNPGS